MNTAIGIENVRHIATSCKLKGRGPLEESYAASVVRRKTRLTLLEQVPRSGSSAGSETSARQA
jgi:hypothetical protein